MVSRQITNAPCSGGPNADGRWICVESRGARGQALVLFDLDTGKTRVLREVAPPERVTGATLSPAGQTVAFVVVQGPQKPVEIRVINANGQGERTAASLPPEVRSAGLNAWIEAEHRIGARIWRKDGTQALGSLSATGLFDVLFELRDIPQVLTVSADGRLVAFDVIQTRGAPERDIRVCDLSSGACEMAVSHPANDLAPNWAPDGVLSFMSDRSGTMGLWAVERAGVHPWATTELIRDTGRGVPTVRGFGDGAIFYDVRVNDFDVYSARLPGSGDQPPAPVRLSPRAVDRNMTPVWSPDGKSVAYISSRGPFPEPGGMRLVIQSLDDGREREFRYDLPANMTRLAWAPDGKRIAMRTIKGGSLPGGVFGIHIVDAATGEFVLESPAE